MKWQIQSQKGMGLLAIMGVVAVIGGSIYFLLLSGENNQKETRLLQAKLELEAFHSGVIAILRDSNSCKLTFADKVFDSELDIEQDQNKFKKAGSDGNFDTSFLINSIIEDRISPADKDKGIQQKIKLKKIRIFSPLPNPKIPLPSNAPKMGNLPTNKGWAVTVGFLYEVYKPNDEKKEKSLIIGSHNMERYHQFIFNNFNESESRLVQHPGTCRDDEVTSDTWSYQLENEQGSNKAKAYIMCVDAKVTNPIKSCYFPPPLEAKD